MSTVTHVTPLTTTTPAEEADALSLDIQVIEHPTSTTNPVAGGSDYLTCKTEESTCDGSDAC
jgi:hypothetical protein